MYSDNLMDKLAFYLARLMDEGEGSWQDKAVAVRAAMAERDAEGNLDEFVSWFPPQE